MWQSRKPIEDWTRYRRQQRRWERVFTPTLPPFLPPPKRKRPSFSIYPPAFVSFLRWFRFLLWSSSSYYNAEARRPRCSINIMHAPTQMSPLSDPLWIFLARSLFCRSFIICLFSFSYSGWLSLVSTFFTADAQDPLFSQSGKFYMASFAKEKVTVSNLSRLTEL